MTVITPKQRAALRAMANGLDTILYVGVQGVTPQTVKEAYDALKAREMIKCAVQQNAPLTAREACEILCEKTGAAPVQVIGRRFVMYRPNEKDPKIVI